MEVHPTLYKSHIPFRTCEAIRNGIVGALSGEWEDHAAYGCDIIYVQGHPALALIVVRVEMKRTKIWVKSNPEDTALIIQNADPEHIPKIRAEITRIKEIRINWPDGTQTRHG